MSHPAPPGGGRLGLTTRRQVVIAALLGALVGYFVIGTLRWRDISVPPSPWSLVVTLVLLAAAALTATPVLRRKILTERALVAPETGLLALVSGKWIALGFLPMIALGPRVVLDRMHTDRVVQIERKLDSFVVALANALRASPSAGRALAMIQPVTPAPLDRGSGTASFDHLEG